MKRISSHQFLLTVIFYLTIFLTYNFSQSKDSLIEKVENGLLPVVLIEGEAPFSLEERMNYYKVPGISITIIKDYKIDWTKHYGVMDSEFQNPVTDETLFNVGSLSKGVAALTVLSLVQEGKVDLNGDINQQLISWKVPENEFTKQGTVTPLLLMNHSSGAMFSPSGAYLPKNFPTNLQVLNGESPSQTKAVIIDKIPGTEYQYSNAGYSILQQLVIDVGEESFSDFTKGKIFLPLEMYNSTFQQPLPDSLIKYASAGHESNGLPLTVKRYFYPHLAAGGLCTTTSDYAKYIIEIQKSYLDKSNKIISRELAEEMLSPHVSKQYGLGVFMREMFGEINYFGHLGDSRGFFAGFAAHLRDGYGAVVFTNSQNGANLIREITNSIAKVYGWDKYLPEEYKVVAVDDKVTDQFCGRYAIGTDDYFEVKKEQVNLFINKFDSAQLYHVGDGKFVTKFRLGYLQFNFDDDQSVTDAVYYFSDELGRFLSDPITCYKMKPGEKVPVELIEEGQVEEALKLYHKIKQDNPSDFNVTENRFNSLGYNYMRRGMLEEAIAIFKLNVEFYPESANTYDSLAEAYMNNGDNELATANYKKSLELNPNNSNADDRLKVLEELNDN